MEAIIKYKAKDGTEFAQATKCQSYEALIDRVAEIMQPWGEVKNDGCNFANGHGFYQRTEALVEVTKKLLMDEAEKAGMTGVPRLRDAHFSHFMRWIDEDRNMEPIRKACYRIYCTDDQFREWGQPFYAMNPTVGDQIQLN